MPYTGECFKVEEKGGWFATDNFDVVPPEAMINPININHHRGGKEPRGGSELVYESAITDTPQITGGYQFKMENGTTFIVEGCSDGTIWVNGTTCIKTGLAANKRYYFETFYDKLYICNGYDIPQVWDGITATTQDFGLGGCSAVLSTVSGGSVNVGTHSYKYSFVSAIGETAGSNKSNVVTVASASYGNINIYNIPIGPSGTTARKIYRTVSGDTGNWKLVDTIADNTTVIFNDSIADASLGADILVSGIIIDGCTANTGSAPGGSLDAGTHSYKITFVATSTETAGSNKSAVITISNPINNAFITNIAIGPTGTTARKLYRTVAGDTGDWKLVTTIADNTTTYFVDTIADSALGASIPTIWGSTAGLTYYPSTWNTAGFPVAFVSHGVRAQKRLWAVVNNYLYASASGSDNMSDASVTTIKILTQSLTALTEFGGRLLVFSKDKSYIVDDTALDTAQWGYQAAMWEGGCAHQGLVVKTPTDVMVIPESLEPFSVTASQQYGDYQIASLVRPCYLNKWIEANVDLTKIAQFHACYDPDLRCIKIFVVVNGKTLPDVAMVYFIDMGVQAGWTKHEYMTPMISSWVVRVSASDWRIYTGGSAGKTFKLESATLRDDSLVYRTEWSTPPLNFGNPRSTKRYDKMWLVMKPVAFETISVNTYIDDRSLSGGYYIVDEYGDFLVDENGNTIVSEPTDPWTITMEGAENILKNFGDDIGSVGTRIQLTIYNTLGENFFITQLLFDCAELGNKYSSR
jgi:hypothetical protein